MRAVGFKHTTLPPATLPASTSARLFTVISLLRLLTLASVSASISPSSAVAATSRAAKPLCPDPQSVISIRPPHAPLEFEGLSSTRVLLVISASLIRTPPLMPALLETFTAHFPTAIITEAELGPCVFCGDTDIGHPAPGVPGLHALFPPMAHDRAKGMPLGWHCGRKLQALHAVLKSLEREQAKAGAEVGTEAGPGREQQRQSGAEAGSEAGAEVGTEARAEMGAEAARGGSRSVLDWQDKQRRQRQRQQAAAAKAKAKGGLLQGGGGGRASDGGRAAGSGGGKDGDGNGGSSSGGGGDVADYFPFPYDWLVLIDDDAFLNPTTLLMRLAGTEPSIALVYGDRWVMLLMRLAGTEPSSALVYGDRWALGSTLGIMAGKSVVRGGR